MATFGITIRRGAAHNSISREGVGTRDLSSMDTEQRKINERVARDGVVAMFNKPGSDRNLRRRVNKQRYGKQRNA